jgi:heme exporter protein D
MDFLTMLQMGKHGFYVWSAYGLVWLCLLFCVCWPIWQEKKYRKYYIKQKKREKELAEAESDFLK